MLAATFKIQAHVKSFANNLVLKKTTTVSQCFGRELGVGGGKRRSYMNLYHYCDNSKFFGTAA